MPRGPISSARLHLQPTDMPPARRYRSQPHQHRCRPERSQRFNPAADIPFDWWTLFQSPQINSLIKRAFKANPDIESAQAALRQAQEYVTAQQGFFYPTVGASYSPSSNKLAGNMGGNSPGMQGNGTVIQTYSNPAGPALSTVPPTTTSTSHN